MNEQFINIYIDNIFNKLNDSIKSELMLQTRITIADQVIATLSDEKNKLIEEINRLNLELNKKVKPKKEDSF